MTGHGTAAGEAGGTGAGGAAGAGGGTGAAARPGHAGGGDTSVAVDARRTRRRPALGGQSHGGRQLSVPGLGLGLGFDGPGRREFGEDYDDFSPYPPIADYAFLSDCEVTALVAPSGAVEWMSLPRMDCPSIFGALLDRDAGWFRFGPEDMSVPADRRYLPGTMVLETSWDCGEGWLVVRDCLVMGPWRHDHRDRSTHRRPPTDYDAEHILLRTVRCMNGSVQLSMDCEPAADYGRQRGRWDHTGQGYHQAVIAPAGADLTLTLTSDIRIGLEGPSARARTRLKEGETRFCALSWGSRKPPADYEDAAARQLWTAHHWQHWLARGSFPDHRWRPLPDPQRADAEGPHVRPHRGDRRRGDYLAAGDAARGAELGLPVQLDPGRDVRPVGPVHAGLRVGGQRLLRVPDRGRGAGRRRPADRLRDRRPVRTERADARPPARLSGRPAGAHRQRGLLPAAERRVGRRAGLAVPAHQVQGPARRAGLAAGPQPGGARAGALARARPGHLGGARRAPALHLVQADVLGRRRPRRPAGPDPRGHRRGRPGGRRRPTRSTPTSAPTPWTPEGCSASTTTPRRWTRRCC